jgi:L-malate glycosyltransferase
MNREAIWLWVASMTETPIGYQVRFHWDSPKKTVRVALISPTKLPALTGNAITVARIAQGLEKHGCDVRVYTPDSFNITNLRKFKPAVLHAFHAYKTGPTAVKLLEGWQGSWGYQEYDTPEGREGTQLSEDIESIGPTKRMKIPFVVTFTGTDANHDLFDTKKRKVIKAVTEKAGAITVFHKELKQKILNSISVPSKKIKVVPPTVVFEEKVKTKFDLRKKLNIPEEVIVFFLPANIRRVKYYYFFLDQLEKLHQLYNIHLVIAGHILEEKTADKLLGKIESLNWIHQILIPHAHMKAGLQQVDVVLNTSLSEGMSNSILEAMCLGRPVLASSIEGNRAIIKNNINGMLFKDKKEFFHKAQRLVLEKKLCERLGEKAQEHMEKHYLPQDEIGGYLRVYSSVLS